MTSYCSTLPAQSLTESIWYSDDSLNIKRIDSIFQEVVKWDGDTSQETRQKRTELADHLWEYHLNKEHKKSEEWALFYSFAINLRNNDYTQIMERYQKVELSGEFWKMIYFFYRKALDRSLPKDQVIKKLQEELSKVKETEQQVQLNYDIGFWAKNVDNLELMEKHFERVMELCEDRTDFQNERTRAESYLNSSAFSDILATFTSPLHPFTITKPIHLPYGISLEKRTGTMKNIYLSLILLIIFPSCTGQSNQEVIKKDQRETVPPDLPEAQIAEYIVEIFEDSKGNLWFGTMAKGAAGYDGEALTYFTTADGLIDNTVVSIREDKEGNIWFGTHSGVSRYDARLPDGQGKTFTNFGSEDGLTGMGCNILVDQKGTLWFGTNDGVFRFDGERFVEFDIPEPAIKDFSYKWVKGKVWSLMEDSQGNIWFGRDGLGACKYDGTSFTHLTKKDGLNSNNVSNILEDQEGNIWFGTLTSDFPEYIKEGGVSCYDGTRITQFPEVTGLSKTDNYALFKDKKGNVWIGAIGHGAYRYDGEMFTLFNQIDRPDLTKRFAIQSFVEDKNGTLWFGFSGGLFRFDGTSFINVTRNGPWQ